MASQERPTLARPLVALAVIATVEGLGLLAIAIFDLVAGLIIGTTGPVEVSNPAALGVQIALYAIFGAGLLVIGWAWRRPARWVRGPFVLAQIIALAVGVEAVGGAGAQRVVAVIAIALAVLGLAVTFSPSVTRIYAER